MADWKTMPLDSFGVIQQVNLLTIVQAWVRFSSLTQHWCVTGISISGHEILLFRSWHSMLVDEKIECEEWLAQLVRKEDNEGTITSNSD